MRYISVFSGVEAASVAWEPLGWEPVAFCEVDEFPSAVLAYRFPNVPNLGDITKVDWSEFADGTVDIVIGGSPCQSFSVAGKREGLKGESGLMFEYIRCVREVRPRYFVWENVPGAFSSEKGEAFRQLLSEMDGLGYGLAWRVLDAQFFPGVAQRRRRVFLVGSLGNQRAAEILFEPDSLRWDHPSSREKRQELTRAAQHGASEDRRVDVFRDAGAKAPSVNHHVNQTPTIDTRGNHIVCAYRRGFGGQMDAQGDVSAALTTNTHPSSSQLIVTSNGEDIVGALCARDFKGVGSQYVSEGKVICVTQYGNEIAGTLTARHDSSPCADRGQNVVCTAIGGEAYGA